MTLVIMNGPPPGDWCPACLMDAKQRQWEAYQEDIQRGYAASADAKPAIIPWPDALTKELRHGGYRAVCGDFPGLGLIDGLCWDHVAGTNPSAPEVPAQLLTANGPLPRRRK